MKKWQLMKQKHRKTRRLRVRKKLRGSALKPRLSVVKTLNHINVQLIDDEKGVTLASTSTLSKKYKGTEFQKKNVNSGKKLGEEIGELAKAIKVKEVVFDRGHSKYHGVIAAVADGARTTGLNV